PRHPGPGPPRPRHDQRRSRQAGEDGARTQGRRPIGAYFVLERRPPKTLTPAPLPTTPSPSPGEGYPWGVLAVLPLLPVRGVERGREKRAGVMRVLGMGGTELASTRQTVAAAGMASCRHQFVTC